MPSLSYQTLGNPDHPAIMLLHGFMSCNGQWLMNTSALGNAHFLVMVELWGHGDSPTPLDETYYSIDAYIEQFENIRSVLGIEHWSLIGQSYGAGLVLNYAAKCPAVCDAVVVTNSRSAFGQLSGAEQKQDPNRADPLDAPDFDLRKLPYHPIHARRFPQHVQDALVAKADAITVDAVKLGGKVGVGLNAVTLLGELAVPVLLTNGKYEKSFQDDLKNLVERYPNLQIAHLDGGHSVNIEAAEGFNQAVLAFLAGQTA